MTHDSRLTTHDSPLRVLTVLAQNDSGATAVWATRQAESLRELGVEMETYLFCERRSLRGLVQGGLEMRRRARKFQADLVHVHYAASMALAVTLFSPVPVVVSYCGSDVFGNYNPRGDKTLSGRLSGLLSQLSTLRARRCIAKSEELKRSLRWPWARARCEVIPNGVNLAQFDLMSRAEARAALGWEHNDPVVLFINRPGAWVKDPDLAHGAFKAAQKAMPCLRLYFVENEPAHRIPLFMNAADVLLITSRHEGSSNAVKEAMACNLPVVSTACGDVPERLEGVQHSYICSRDPQELGARLVDAVRAGERSDGRLHVQALNSERIAQRVQTCYETALRPALADIPEALRGSARCEQTADAPFDSQKIIYVTTSLPYAAGESFVIPEIKALQRRGHQVLVVPRSTHYPVVHKDAESLLAVTATQKLISWRIARAALSEIGRNPRKALRAGAMLLRSRNPYILLKNGAVYGKGLWLGRIAREWGADHIHAHWAMTTATIAMVASEVSDTPWSFTAHRGDIVLSNLLELKMGRAAFTRFISRSGREMARRLVDAWPEERVHVLHMGVELPAEDESNPKSQIPNPKSDCVIVCPANLLPVKGHAYLIDAMGILKQRGVAASLWIAGQGALEGRLRHQVAQCDLTDRVRFLGQLSHAALLQLYAEGQADMVVLPSVDLGNGLHEGIPVALIEAMAYGIPTVSTTTGGIPELLAEGAGALASPQDAAALADAIERLIRDPGLREDLIRAGRQRVEEAFAIECVTDQLVKLFLSHDS